MTESHRPPDTAKPRGAKLYEERDVAMRPIVAGAVFLAVLMVGTAGLMWALQRVLVARETAQSAPASPLAATYGRAEPPAPRLQANPRRDLAELRAREQTLLDGYAWADRAAGRVRIPVERAMALVLGEGKQ
jgi:hypothetical protein